MSGAADMPDGRLYSVKMRASQGARHISGAERIVPEKAAAKTVAALAARALSHSNGRPDFVNVKLEAVGDVERLESLPVATEEVGTVAEGWEKVCGLLGGFPRIREIVSLFKETYGMRGAMLLDADTLERLDPDPVRGVRATYMDAASGAPAVSPAKDHYSEAVVLATKVQNAPGIVAEICVSDDPGYVTGYVAAKNIGYRRITKLKDPDDPCGGRIFLYRGRREDVPATIEYLEKRCVVVEHVPPNPSPFPQLRRETVRKELEAVRQAGLYRTDGGRADGFLDFSSNDYLGLARHPAVAAAAARAAGEWGAGSRASRLVTGTLPPHEIFERHIAAFKGFASAISYPAGYMANVGVLTALAGKGDIVFSDELNHASIIDGARLSGADVAVYPHLDMDALEKMLAASRTYRRRIVVSDGVFSMDGDMLDLGRFVRLCSRCDAFSVVDEAHALGTVGKSGKGLTEVFGVRPDVSVGTMSKALGSQGGYACADACITDLLRQKSRPFIFSTAACPASVAAADAALSILESDPSGVRRLSANVSAALSALSDAGFRVKTQSAIIPVAIGDEREAAAVSREMESDGVIAKAIRYPTVARGRAVIRVAVSATHSREDVARLAASLARAVRKVRKESKEA